MYMAKKDAMAAQNSHITFTPPQQVHHWQVSFIAQDNTTYDHDGDGGDDNPTAQIAAADVIIETLDVEGDAVTVARLNEATDWTLNADGTKWTAEVIVDSTAKSLKVYNKKASKTMDVKVIAYRSTDDVMGGSFSEDEGVTYAAS
tara:strand:- start:1456 stop:1890 length:435 start_codon:yes stop_codon:yes gene_type:complete